MTGISKTIWQYLLATDGINQLQRTVAALDPANVKLEDRSLRDLLRFVNELSTQIRFYNEGNVFMGNWRSFFDRLQSNGDIMSETDLQLMLLLKKDLSPHLALLLAYLKAYLLVASDLNNITKKRLDYYYEEVLKLKRIQPQPDEVHVLFELTKNAKPTKVELGALLEAGKTTAGLPLQYALEKEIVVNHASLEMIRSSLREFKTVNQTATFKANDATTILSSTGSGWRPFGESQLPLPIESQTMEAVYFGWAIASPNFLLAEGKRIVRLNLSLTSAKGIQPADTDLSSMIDVSFTGEKDWITGLQPQSELKPVGVPNPLSENPYTLTVNVELSEVLPAVTKYDEATHKTSYSTRWPVMRIGLKPESNLADLLSIFHVNNVVIEVEVKEVKKLILQNDQSIQPVDKPILPFGSIPVIQSNFYIGSEEIFGKTLTSISVNLTWQDSPASFSNHYSEYKNNNIVNNSFSTSIELLNNRNWNVRLVNDDSLFNLANTSFTKTIAVSKGDFSIITSATPFQRNADLVLPDSFDSSINQGFLRLVLKGPTTIEAGNLPVQAPFEAFGHKTFPFVFTEQMLALSKWDGNPPKPELPKPPYIPVLKSVSLDYTASDQFSPSSPNFIEQFFVQDIFGPAEVEKDDTAFLVASQPGLGVLYLGLKNSDASQAISFLFQVEEGDVEAEKLLRSSDLQWSYLAGNHWIAIASTDVSENSTDGFQKPGLIRLNIGNDATEKHSLMPTGLRWIRTSVKENMEGAASINGIRTQAARAKLKLTDDVKSYEKHLAAPLEKETISKLTVKIPGIKKVIQPYPSLGGHNIESDADFYRRTNERLRHKNRAVAVWDFERMVLEHFPDIFKIKCLAHTDDEEFFQPGNVRFVVVPDWRKRPTGNPLQPKVSRNKLREISDFINNNYVSAFAQVYVSNPNYETLLVDCKVSFRADFDPGFYSVILEEDIKKFLSPWAYEEGRDIVFGGKIHASEILGFIEGRDYVDFVTDFELYHRFDGPASGGISEMEIAFDFIIGDSPEAAISESSTSTGGKTINVDFIVGVPVEVAVATRPDTILVSNFSHRIQALQSNMTHCEGVQNIGIGQMIIGIDFVPIS